jgi:protein TonB
MRDAGLAGTVPIEARIGTDGSVVSAQVASARVHPEFAAAAIDAVRQWQFSPTLLNGTAIEVLMTVRVQFRLEE